LSAELRRHVATYHVVYWNDVWEHIPPDEIRAYVRQACRLLVPGGQLVTITPNWHVRPSDVTKLFKPPGSEPEGFHLREYTLREVASILREAGFEKVTVPLAVTRNRTFLAGRGFFKSKCLLEPMLEFVPFRACKVLTGGLGYHATIASWPTCSGAG